MQYIGFIFGIFGLLAYIQVSALKRKVETMEEQLARTEGTSYYDDRRALVQAAQSYLGKQVKLEFKEDHQDVDAVMYGNTKHGAITILGADEEWMLVRIESLKGSKDKLLRMESIQRISLEQ